MDSTLATMSARRHLADKTRENSECRDWWGSHFSTPPLLRARASRPRPHLIPGIRLRYSFRGKQRARLGQNGGAMIQHKTKEFQGVMGGRNMYCGTSTSDPEVMRWTVTQLWQSKGRSTNKTGRYLPREVQQNCCTTIHESLRIPQWKDRNMILPTKDASKCASREC